jgi:hypothetical protein
MPDDTGWGAFAMEVMKAVMKQGYLYGVGEDGELYCIEAKMPKPGETIVMPPFHMPKEVRDA